MRLEENGDEVIDYGPKLTDEEYEKMIIDLHSDLPAATSRTQEKFLRRRELELSIDHRLGRDFPRFRREALWAIQQRIERRRLLLTFKYVMKRIFGSGINGDANRLVSYMKSEYSDVLSKSELIQFFRDEISHPETLTDSENSEQ